MTKKIISRELLESGGGLNPASSASSLSAAGVNPAKNPVEIDKLDNSNVEAKVIDVAERLAGARR
jgi:hypothetical protein